MTAGAEMQHAAVSGGRNISTSSAAETAAATICPDLTPPVFPDRVRPPKRL